MLPIDLLVCVCVCEIFLFSGFIILNIPHMYSAFCDTSGFRVEGGAGRGGTV
jgi:hypothetical protein